MVKGLVAGFGEPIAHELPALRNLGVQLIRTDCQRLTVGQTRDRVLEIQTAGLVPFPIIRSVEQLAGLPAGTNVELRNEPDLEGPSAAAYELLVGAFAKECDRLGHQGWAGAISNFNMRGFQYLQAAHVERWPSNLCVSMHWYPHGDTPQVPHPGFRSRDDEVAMLRSLIGSRRWGLSEIGYHTGNRATSWWDKLLGKKKQWTDQQVKEFVTWEWAFWERMGAVGMALYQLNDGPTDAPIDRCGIRRTNGMWKPVADTFRLAA